MFPLCSDRPWTCAEESLSLAWGASSKMERGVHKREREREREERGERGREEFEGREGESGQEKYR
jgi:hypothetical protein